MNTVTAPGRPELRDSFLDRVMDLDSHEATPTHFWDDMFGRAGRDFLELGGNRLGDGAENSLVRPDVTADDLPIDDATVWTVKGAGAPGAFDLSRRVAVMDQMGIARQFVFPGFAQGGMFLRYNPNAVSWFKIDEDKAGTDRVELARRIFRAHNEWVVKTTRELGSDRLRIVPFVAAETFEGLMTETEYLIDNGVRVIQIPVGEPPAGMSPADARLDPFWRLCAENDVPVVVHIGTHQGLFASPAWGLGVPAFAPTVGHTEEFGVEPYGASIMQFGPDNMLCAMILGGVFERHPRLRFGAIELAAHWVGPLAEKLDMWVEQFKGPVRDLPMKPSEYLVRNVRVTPFHFEPTERYLARYPELTDVYAYCSDYPHREGGKWSKQLLVDRLKGFDEEVLRKFFVMNGAWLLPD